MKKGFSFLALLCLAVCTHSQKLTPSVLAADGGISKAAGISLEWTLGETFIESLSTTDRLYTQGFHQPLLIAKVFPAPVEQALTGYQVTVFPNPVESFLTATVASPKNERIYLTLIDFTGKRFPVQSATGKFSTINVNMSARVSGIYLLEVRNESHQIIKTFKIIKGL